MSRYRGTFSGYYAQAADMAVRLMEDESPDSLLTVDPEEYLDYLVQRLEFQPLSIHWDKESVEPFKKQVTRPARPMDLARGNQVSEIVEMWRVRIPTEPNPDRDGYFALEGSTGYLSGEPRWHFEGGVMVAEIPASERAITDLRDQFRRYTDGRNEDITKGNAKLRHSIRPVWTARRAQLETNATKSRAEFEKLGLKLYQRPGAATPIAINPRRIEIPKPRAKPHDPEPALPDETVEMLVKHLATHGRQLETAPGTYAKFDEEELRDVVLGLLNTSFGTSTDGVSGTAETFSKLGKTDIQLKVDGHVPLVIECKFWGGPKAYLEALAQLFDYVTWRHSHAVLLHFSKTRDLTATINTAMEAIASDKTTVGAVAQKSDSSFVSRHKHPQDEGKTVEVHHLFFDLSLSPNRTRARGEPTGDKRD